MSSYSPPVNPQIVEHQDSKHLRENFAKLMDPHEDPVFVLKYVRELRFKLKESVPPFQPRFTPFAYACVRQGVVRTMIAVARHEVSSSRVRYIAQYNALEALSALVQCGDVSERDAVTNELLELGIVELCLQNMRHRLCMIRQAAISVLRSLGALSRLGEKISASSTGDIIEAVCLYVLRGPEHVVTQMIDPATSWQGAAIMEGGNARVDDTRTWALRLYGSDQISAMWVAQGLLGTSPPHARKFCFDLLKKKPQLLDLLLDCAVLDRIPFYPDIQAVSIASQVLILLFQWPSHVIPGVSTPTNEPVFQTQELKVMFRTISILTSRQDWTDKLIEVWMKIQEEDLQTLQREVADFALKYPESTPPEQFSAVLQSRSVCRIAVLRLIATITHAAESIGVSNGQIESFLHIAYAGCRKIKLSHECITEADHFAAIEQDKEIADSPLWTIVGNLTAKEPLMVAPEAVMGPTALIRLLVVLAQRNALDGIQSLRKPPTGLSSSTSLKHIQQITHPDVIRRAIVISQKRLRKRMETGRACFAEKEGSMYNRAWDYIRAGAAFISAAELAAALIALDTYTGGIYATEVLGARTQLVIALGNAAQTALNLQHYRRAYNYAWAAVSAAENIPPQEELNPEITAKNKERMKKANAGRDSSDHVVTMLQ